ncbi:unnamed protein product [Schistocephalus solidus]|uniref:Uncharacterized protein n=1 Tax=Schistocephalus solidus TaxID=70667 RepID=A0A183SB23_SCHSO|nr:unnamed protein product [Schistocephalus solidus]
MIEKNMGEDLPGDVEQRNASVIITELPVPLPLVEMDDGPEEIVLGATSPGRVFLSDHPDILHLPQSLLYKAPASEKGCFGGVIPKVHSEPHLGDDEVVICPTISIADRLVYQHVLSISPPDESIVQQLPPPRPRVHPRGLLPCRKAEEGVVQQETVFRTRAQKKDAIIATATETAGTQLSLSGSVVRPDAGVEVTKNN